MVFSRLVADYPAFRPVFGAGASIPQATPNHANMARVLTRNKACAPADLTKPAPHRAAREKTQRLGKVFADTQCGATRSRRCYPGSQAGPAGLQHVESHERTQNNTSAIGQTPATVWASAQSASCTKAIKAMADNDAGAQIAFFLQREECGAHHEKRSQHRRQIHLPAPMPAPTRLAPTWQAMPPTWTAAPHAARTPRSPAADRGRMPQHRQHATPGLIHLVFPAQAGPTRSPPRCHPQPEQTSSQTSRMQNPDEGRQQRRQAPATGQTCSPTLAPTKAMALVRTTSPSLGRPARR